MHKMIPMLVVAVLLAAPAAYAQSGEVSRLPGQTERPPPPSAEERMASQDLAGRVRLLREADLALRNAFADYQAALTKARDKGKAPGAEAVLALDAARAPNAAIQAVADDMSNAAIAQQEATHTTRNAFRKFAAASDDLKGLEGAAGQEAVAAAFGTAATP